MTARTHLILDGISEPQIGRRLSAAWASAGFDNAVDVAGQCAWIAVSGPSPLGERGAEGLSESDVDRAAAIARWFGLEIHDRAGATFRADNDLAALRRQVTYEYKSRFATAAVFGLPALAMHCLGPMLAGATSPRGMLYPWLIEMLLVGWACVAAGWPILWQGMLSLCGLRATGDLLTSVILIIAYVPSAIGVLSLTWTPRPWFIAWNTSGGASGGGPMFHAAMITLLLAVLSRWMAHAQAERLSGRANLMLRGFGRLIVLWLILAAGAGIFGRWEEALAVAMLLPPMMSLGGVNPWNPGWSAALPVLCYLGNFLMGPAATHVHAGGVKVEIAGGFGLLMTLTMGWGWRKMRALKNGA